MIARQGRRGKNYQGALGVSEGFHGRPSRGELEIDSIYRYEKNLANLGYLIDIEIVDPDSPKMVQELPFPKNQFILGCSPDQKQLYVVSINNKRMDINVREFSWIDEDEAGKPKVMLGEAAAISYFTDKHHLQGPKYQKHGAPYRHEFGTEGTNTGMLPMVVYDRKNGVVEILGGSYVVTELGIKG